MEFGRRPLFWVLTVLPLAFIAGLTSAWFDAGESFDLLTRTLGYASLVFWAATAAAAAVTLYQQNIEPQRRPYMQSRYRSRKRWPYISRDVTPALSFAALALALFLAALGAAVLPGNGKTNEIRDARPPQMLGIDWTVAEPLRVWLPGMPSPMQHRAAVVFEVVDSQHPNCFGVKYRWTFHQEGSADDDAAITRRDDCEAISELEPGRVVAVRVTDDGATGEATITVRRTLIASFGDSVASGEGNPSRKPKWEDSSKCNRSALAGPRQAAEKAAIAERHAVVTFFHLACTGAWIDGVGAPQWAKDRPSLLPQTLGRQPSELEQFRQATRTSDGEPIVFLSVGANDLGFGPILAKCARPASPGNCFNKKLGRSRVRELIAARFAALEGSFSRLAAKAPFAGSDVYLTQYFDPLHDERGKLCGRPKALGLSQAESGLAEKLILVPLNDLLRREATARHWRFVDGIASAFRSHGYCAKDRWVVRLLGAAVRLNLQGTFHPNAEGQREYGDRIFAVLKPHLPGD